MCGLIAYYNASQEGGFTAVNQALDAMSYRGDPMSRGVTRRGNWVIGHNRLAIQDLSPAGAQPIEEDHYSVAFVGEFFVSGSERGFFREQFRPESRSRLKEADGFWSIVSAHDAGYLDAYTDHLGIKPLYFWEDAGIICSELSPMFAIRPAPDFDYIHLATLVKHGFDYSGRTPYKGIVQIPPGHRLVIDPNYDAEILPYWNIFEERLKAPHTAESLRQLLFTAISNRMTSDVPVCLLLSGGLDSSFIYYAMKELGVTPKVFSVDNGEGEFLPEGVELLDPVVPDNILEIALRSMQTPSDLGSMVPQYLLGQAVHAAGYKVAISGDGADELFGGYRRSQEYDSQMTDTMQELPFYHLPRLDRQMMRHTVELRSPFLAPDVVRFAFGLPRGQRTSKALLKEAARGLVPDRIIDRDKHPLKTKAVISGGYEYRQKLVNMFTNGVHNGIPTR